MQHTSIYESPASFWKWSAYTTIASTLKDRCYLRQGDGYLFTNIYVLFLAESSGHRKGRPVDLSETLINKLQNTKIISGRASVQAILDELARAETDPTTGKVIKSSTAVFYAPELSAGIVADPDALKILTDIYDYKSNPYKSRLRTGPCFNLERIVFNILAATNEDMIKAMFDVSVIKGGFLARTFLVLPNEFRKSNSLLRVDKEERKLSLENVYKKLLQINALVGEFQLTEDATEEYEGWYNPFRASYAQKKESTGIIGRVHTGVLKLAMIFAANELTMCVSKEHVERAIEECLSLLPNYTMFTMRQSSTDVGNAGGYILTDLLEAPGNCLSRKIIIREHWRHFDTDTLEKVIETLQQADIIQQVDSGKLGLFLRLTPQGLKMLKGEDK